MPLRAASVGRPARDRIGAVAQLGERELCKLEVVGSIPIGSTNLRCAAAEVVPRSPSGRRGTGAASRSFGWQAMALSFSEGGPLQIHRRKQ